MTVLLKGFQKILDVRGTARCVLGVRALSSRMWRVLILSLPLSLPHPAWGRRGLEESGGSHPHFYATSFLGLDQYLRRKGE